MTANGQVMVARENLPREHLKEVVNACLQTLQLVQRQSYDNMAAEWGTMDLEMLCATVNDTHRMQEKMHEFSDQVCMVDVTRVCCLVLLSLDGRHRWFLVFLKRRTEKCCYPCCLPSRTSMGSWLSKQWGFLPS